MPQAVFTKDFDYRTQRRSVVAYKAGHSGSVPQAHYDAALEAGAIEVGAKAEK